MLKEVGGAGSAFALLRNSFPSTLLPLFFALDLLRLNLSLFSETEREL